MKISYINIPFNKAKYCVQFWILYLVTIEYSPFECFYIKNSPGASNSPFSNQWSCDAFQLQNSCAIYCTPKQWSIALPTPFQCWDWELWHNWIVTAGVSHLWNRIKYLCFKVMTSLQRTQRLFLKLSICPIKWDHHSRFPIRGFVKLVKSDEFISFIYRCILSMIVCNYLDMCFKNEPQVYTS